LLALARMPEVGRSMAIPMHGNYQKRDAGRRKGAKRHIRSFSVVC
jgi:hypothetical protein